MNIRLHFQELSILSYLYLDNDQQPKITPSLATKITEAYNRTASFWRPWGFTTLTLNSTEINLLSAIITNLLNHATSIYSIAALQKILNKMGWYSDMVLEDTTHEKK